MKEAIFILILWVVLSVPLSFWVGRKLHIRSQELKVVCSWCKDTIKERPWWRFWDRRVSHGMCTDCGARLAREYEEGPPDFECGCSYHQHGPKD